MDVLNDDNTVFFGLYSHAAPPNILILDTYKNINKIGVVVHELAHHLECYGYPDSKCDNDSIHGYHYQLAKSKVFTWCRKNVSNTPDWNLPLKASQNDIDMKAFKL